MAQQKSAKIINISHLFGRNPQKPKGDAVRVSLRRTDLETLRNAWSASKNRIDGLWDIGMSGVVMFDDNMVGFQMLSKGFFYQKYDLTIEKMEQGPKMFYNVRGQADRKVRCETIEEVVNLVKNVAATAQKKRPKAHLKLVPKG